MTDEPIDVRALVADIEATVARRRAAGEYPAELLERLHVELGGADEAEPIDTVAHVDLARPLRSDRAVVGPAVVFAKRVLRRAMSWYVAPFAESQSRFNFGTLRRLGTVEARLARLETRWEPPPAPAAGDPAALQGWRVDQARRAAAEAPEGVVAVLEPPDAGFVAALAAGVAEVLVVASDPARLEAVGSAASRGERADALDFLDASTLGLAVAVLPGLVHRLAPAELLRLLPAAAAALRPGGRLVLDAPDPGGDRGVLAVLADPAARRPVWPDTVALLCEAAGLEVARVERAREEPWYCVVAARPA